VNSHHKTTEYIDLHLFTALYHNFQQWSSSLKAAMTLHQ